MALTAQQITDTITRASCCLADMNYKLAQKRAQGSKDDCLQKKVILLTMYVEALRNVLECPDPDNPPLVSANDCNLLGISGGTCWDGINEVLYIINADGAGVLPYQDYWYEYAFSSNDNGPWTVANGYNEWYSAIPIDGSSFTYIRVTIKCNEFDLNSEEIIFEYKTYPSEYDAFTFGYYSTTTNPPVTLIPSTLYIHEGDDITFSNLNTDFIITDITNVNTVTSIATNVQSVTIQPSDPGYPADGQQLSFSFGYIGTGPALPCDLNRLVTVQIVPDPVITPSSVNLCIGGTVDLEVTNYPYASYLWSTGETTSSITVSTGGTYSVLVGDGTITGLIDYQAIVLDTNIATPIIINQSTGFELDPITYLAFPDVDTLEIVDAGIFSGGYPVGTTFEWVGITSGPSTITTDNGSSYQAIVTLPSGCTATSPVYTVYTLALNTDNLITNESCDGLDDGAATYNVDTAPLIGTSFTLTNVVFEWYNSVPALIQTTSGVSTTDSMSNLAPGNYTLDITGTYSNGLVLTSGTLNFTVVAATPVVAGAPVVTNITCPSNDINAPYTGAVDFSASGGTAPYQYFLNGSLSPTGIDGAINLAAGAYTWTVEDANGCVGIGTPFNVTQPADFVISAAETACDSGTSNGEFQISVVTAPGTIDLIEIYDSLFNLIDAPILPIGLPYTVSGLAADTYSIYVYTNAGCQYSQEVVVTVC